ncbi:hypothetical protein [Flavobacterium cerinum]|uniref:Uncharacterized protein n=1 Tax=Flavobacterium cerinum TaxID=2502784 RepID=A0A3S3SEU9_9FLAO|nr:hypothetical protein [Flavobacterium cerinum]RWX00515.1 hypothetical protein EPI11_09580 [Flavobacterium cerinum]
MKKLLLIMLAISAFSYSQTKEERQKILDKKKAMATYSPRDSLNYPVKYCLLMATSKFLSPDVDLEIDYGQDATYFEDKKIRDRNGKKILFNSVIDALNYMSSIGWEFVNAYVITVGNQNVYHYLMKNENVNPDYIPKTKRDFKLN